MPIARRELLVTAKRGTLYRSRTKVGVVMMILGIGFAIAYQYSGARGTTMFLGAAKSWLIFGPFFMGASLTSDSISRERREGTLGLLFLAGLPSYQIVGGKFIAHGIRGFYNLLLIFPLLSLVIVAGGVQFGDMVSAMLLMLNLFFLSASIGMFASCTAREAKTASSRAVTIPMLFLFGSQMFAQWLGAKGAPGWIIQFFALFDFSGRGRTGKLLGSSSWEFLLAIHLLGWFFLALAMFLLPHIWQDEKPGPKRSYRERFRDILRGSATGRERLRRRLLGVNPFLWLASRGPFRFSSIWIATVAMIGIAVWAEQKNPGSVIFLVVGATLMHKIMMCGVASGQLVIEQEQGSLEMLLSTPLTSREIVRGQYLAAVRRFRGPAILLLLVHLYVWYLALHSRLSLPFLPSPAMAWVLAPVYTAMYFFDMHTAIWLGMWGVTQSTVSQGAAGFAATRLLVAPAAIFFGGIILIYAAHSFLGVSYPVAGWSIPVIWFALGIGNNIFWLKRARKNLPFGIWEMAFRRYFPEPVGLIGKLGGLLGRYFGQLLRNRRLAANGRQI